MKKRMQYFLIIGSTLALSTSVVGGLTVGILTYNETHHWSINPYQNFDFVQTKKSLQKAKVPEALINEYLVLAKKITGATSTNEIIKASELLNLDNKIMNSISQRMIWDNESPGQVQIEINFAKPVLTQFYEYYDHVYIYQNNLFNDSLNNMQLKSSNTDLYKWGIGSNISDYGLIKNYLVSAEDTWISKMSMAYIFQTFLNKKRILYNSLIDQANNAIIDVNNQIEEYVGSQNKLLNDKYDAQDHYLLATNFKYSVEEWQKKLSWTYGLLMTAWGTQIGLSWFPLIAWTLVPLTVGLGFAYSTVEKNANEDLQITPDIMQKWFKHARWISSGIKTTVALILVYFKNNLSKWAEIALKLTGWIMAFLGVGLLTAEFITQSKEFNEVKKQMGNSDSDVSNAINNHIKELDIQINNISEKIKQLNIKENDYMNQKIIFNGKLNELLNYNKFFKDFDSMNDKFFAQTNLFTSDQIKSWQKQVEVKYGYLTGNSIITDDFIEAFNKEKNNFSNKYLVFQSQEKNFIDNYHNNDKEYFIKNLLVNIDNPLKNNYTYFFNSLNIMWDNYDDIFRG